MGSSASSTSGADRRNRLVSVADTHDVGRRGLGFRVFGIRIDSGKSL